MSIECGSLSEPTRTVALRMPPQFHQLSVYFSARNCGKDPLFNRMRTRISETTECFRIAPTSRRPRYIELPHKRHTEVISSEKVDFRYYGERREVWEPYFVPLIVQYRRSSRRNGVPYIYGHLILEAARDPTPASR